MLAVVGRNTMEVYLWQFTLFFIFDAVFILLFNPVQSHTVFVDEVFSEGYIFYRIFRIILTVVCMCLYGEMKTKRKASR